MTNDNAAPSGGQHQLHQFSSGEPGQAGAGDVQSVSAAPNTKALAGCTGIARVGICIRCDRLYLGGPQIAPLAKREGGVYHCIEFVSNGQRLADNPKEHHETR